MEVPGCRLALPRPQAAAIWSQQWHAPEKWLQSVEAALRAEGAAVLRGGDYDRWDLEVRGGILGVIRLRMAIEDHGGGRQFARFRWWPRCSPAGLALTLLFAALSGLAVLDQAPAAAAVLGVVALLLAARMLDEGAAATAALERALEHCRPRRTQAAGIGLRALGRADRAEA